MMKALAVISFLTLLLAQPRAENAEYEKQVADSFHYLTQLCVQSLEQRLHRDILDPNPPEEVPWQAALDEVVNQYAMRPEGYKDF